MEESTHQYKSFIKKNSVIIVKNKNMYFFLQIEIFIISPPRVSHKRVENLKLTDTWVQVKWKRERGVCENTCCLSASNVMIDRREYGWMEETNFYLRNALKNHVLFCFFLDFQTWIFLYWICENMIVINIADTVRLTV